MTVDQDLAIGDRVAVREAWPPGHLRTPAYIRGQFGIVAQDLGPYPNPEEVAFRRPGTPALILYRVRFRQADIWPDYAGQPSDTLDVEIYRHWLEPA